MPGDSSSELVGYCFGSGREGAVCSGRMGVAGKPEDRRVHRDDPGEQRQHPEEPGEPGGGEYAAFDHEYRV